jgi:phosphomannomutase
LTNDITLDDFISSLPVTYTSPEIKVHCSDKIKFGTIENISNEVLKKYNTDDVITIDGVRVKNRFGWWLIRASNTEEALVVRFEGQSMEDKNKLFNEVKQLLNNQGLTLENN